MQERQVLGKGLASLIPERPRSERNEALTAPTDGILKIPLSLLTPNPDQPRKVFSDQEVNELSSSIRQHGLLQPILVLPKKEGKYRIIAGERRFRAAKLAGLTEIPATIRDIPEKEILEIALIENVQRENLNPIEEAGGYKALMDQFGTTAEEVAKKVGKSRSTVANSLRLLYLPRIIREDIEKGRLTAGHARALLAVKELSQQLELRERILDNELSVREIEGLVKEKRSASAAGKGRKAAAPAISAQIRKVLDEMTLALGTKVKYRPDKAKKGGEVIIEYYNVQDFDRIYRRIVGPSEAQ